MQESAKEQKRSSEARLEKIELEKSYNPALFEQRIYQLWLGSQSFVPKKRRGIEGTFSLVMPPPNVTGILHIGHALDNVLQDIVVRYKRMCGFETLWVPGEDHAGIATQNVVEKMLRKDGIDPASLTRNEFIKKTYEVAEEHKKTIQKQLRQMGVSVDWDREHFTMDEHSSKAVIEAFCSLYETGAIYKGEYLVNWCPSCGTALSDEEVSHEDETSFLYYVNYPLLNSEGKEAGFIEIATTRPETMLADVAVACNPDDERYKELVGHFVRLPIVNKKIPIIADAYVEKDFGSGLVKITPAHDKNDWEVGKRHNLEVINILTTDGKLGGNVPERYKGLTVAKARALICKELEEEGLLKDKKKLKHAVGKCYRCGTTIEPYLSAQWFLKMGEMAKKALKAWEEKGIVFHPKKWENTYKHWLEGIRDWCISRQLVWGHRIPVWTCATCGKDMVSREGLEKCKYCSSTDIKQDEDVLDTWFSSGLWPLSTLGWPEGWRAGESGEKNCSAGECVARDYKRFFPTQALVTGYDIIFFWVSRMIMFSLHFAKSVPFRDVYLHGLVRDKKGRKMSKSLGNGIDPLVVIDEYGADAMKFTLSFLCATGQDILIDMDTFKMGSRFANKIWNATRYIFSNLDARKIVPVAKTELKEIEKWILHSLNDTAKNVREALDSYRYSDASKAVYEFFWNNYCDWYVEGLKLSFKESDEEKDRATSVCLSILEESLRLLHPFLSFVTEELYQKLPKHCVQYFVDEKAGDMDIGMRSDVLATAEYPLYCEKKAYEVAYNKFSLMQEVVKKIRSLRLDLNIQAGEKVDVALLLNDASSCNIEERDVKLMEMLSHSLKIVLLESDGKRPASSIGSVGRGFQVFIIIEKNFDVEGLKSSFTKKKAELEKVRVSIESKLSNENFVKNAPEDVIAKDKNRLEEVNTQEEVLTSYIKDLEDLS